MGQEKVSYALWSPSHPNLLACRTPLQDLLNLRH